MVAKNEWVAGGEQASGANFGRIHPRRRERHRKTYGCTGDEVPGALGSAVELP